jgi:hypothetical protein
MSDVLMRCIMQECDSTTLLIVTRHFQNQIKNTTCDKQDDVYTHECKQYYTRHLKFYADEIVRQIDLRKDTKNLDNV